jgi:uncharacterized membrane protein YhiD involved in acid resistance
VNKETLKKYALFATAGIVMIAAAGTIGLSSVAAETFNPQSTLVQNIASKFNLKTEDVQKVFDDTHTQVRSSRLDQAIADGKITTAQKDLILKKEIEIRAKVDEINAKQLTVEERRTALTNLRSEMSKWATDNKIPAEILGFGMRGAHGKYGGYGMGMMR